MPNCGPRPTHFGSRVVSAGGTPEMVYKVPTGRLAEVQSATITNLTQNAINFSIYRGPDGAPKDNTTAEFSDVEIGPGETWVTTMKWVMGPDWELWVDDAIGGSINFSFDGSERDV